MASRTALIEQYTRQGNSKKAIELLQLELAEHPDDANLHALLALNLLREKRMAAAEHEALLALKSEPELTRAHLVYGHVMLARQRYETALESFSSAVALSPREPDAHLGLGRCQEHLGNRIAARKSYEQARGLDPAGSGPHFRLAAMALEERDMDAAEASAAKALELEAEDADNLVLMGMVRYHQWRIEESNELCLAALRLNPQHLQARRLLFWLKARKMPWLAPWWNWASWIGQRDQNGRIFILVTMFLVYKLILYILWDLGFREATVWLRWAWLAMCAYTWFSPAYFDWLVEREKKRVELKDEF